MSPQDKEIDAFETSGTSPPAKPAANFTQHEKPHRTLGLKLFDVFLYPLLNNVSVFLISVGATYLTNRGHTQFRPGTFMDKVGKVFHARGTWLEDQFARVMPRRSAEMAKMVFFSFADGTVIAPFIKLLEDRREKIGKWIDDRLGTTPADLSIYKAEPKQTWGSVLSGRLATAVVVAPTAWALDKLHVRSNDNFVPLNDFLFRQPGLYTGELVQAQPKLARWFGNLDIREIFRVTYFEAFYTSVCTAGLYFISRAFARHHDKTTHRLEHDGAVTAPAKPPAANDARAASNDDTPLPKVSGGEVQSRLAAKAPEAAVTA